LASEVAHAAVRLDRRRANDIVNVLLGKYEKDIPTPPLGKRYQECCDVERGIPLPEYADLYQQVKAELGEIGLKV
jgi:hypothetical protein